MIFSVDSEENHCAYRHTEKRSAQDLPLKLRGGTTEHNSC